MKTTIDKSINLMTKVKDNLILIKKHYPYLNNVEYEICENINKSDELISELKTLSKILILSPEGTHIIVDK